jgi:hypothetical protein
MPIKRYYATKDTTITNAYKNNLVDLASNSNMGAADSLELFSIVGQANTASLEQSRILVQFSTDQYTQDVDNSKVSGEVKHYLILSNVKHPFSVPKDFNIMVAPLSRSWDEGRGIDMENYSDFGWSDIYSGSGATWRMASENQLWSTAGGDLLPGNQYRKTFNFKTGLENLELDITDIFNAWKNETIPNYGLLIKLSGSFEDGTQNTSFYTKKFSARGSEYFYSRPCVETRFHDSSKNDDRYGYYPNTNNKVHFYNIVRGKRVGLEDTTIVSLYSSSLLNQGSLINSYTASNDHEGGYFTFNISLDQSVIYDKWIDQATGDTLYTGQIYRAEEKDEIDSEYAINITNLKSKYSNNENVKLKIFVREKDWQPTIYSKAYNNVDNTYLENLYYKIFRVNDNYTIVNYSTGALEYSKTNYNSDGNYFTLDTEIFEKDYTYGIKLAIYDGVELKEFKNIFKFRVE